MSGILYVVATPIGNLDDVTLRALRILRDVSLIAAEDTRRTARLLQHYSISTPTTSLHAHNERKKTPGLIARLTRGDSIAVVSDAGTPLVSDPGQTLVAAAREEGVRVESVPGPSAVIAALSIAGFPTSAFTFLGFPPTRSKDLEKWASAIAHSPHLIIFFEAPHRIRSTLPAIAQYMPPHRPVLIARELTKLHEESVVCTISTALARLPQPRGEFTVVIPPGSVAETAVTSPDAEAIAAEIGQMIETAGITRRQALRQVSKRYGLTTNELYDLLREAE